jgi:hypothetical protein
MKRLPGSNRQVMEEIDDEEAGRTRMSWVCKRGWRGVRDGTKGWRQRGLGGGVFIIVGRTGPDGQAQSRWTVVYECRRPRIEGRLCGRRASGRSGFDRLMQD